MHEFGETINKINGRVYLRESFLIFLTFIVGLFLPISQASASIKQAASPWISSDGTCIMLDNVRNSGRDAAPAIAACLKHLDRQVLELKPGKYTLLSQLTITRSRVVIRTQNIRAALKACRMTNASACALLVVDGLALEKAGSMPIEINADNVTFAYLGIIGGPDRDADWRGQFCADANTAPWGGGLRVRGSSFTLMHSVIRGMSCYAAVEITQSALRPQIINNMIGPNGDHSKHRQWSDGITIHDSQHATVNNNTLIDNTDVQLIFGGCKNCRVIGNIFRHGKYFSGSSFAEIMIHSWPNTSGDYFGSVFKRNDIDCGPLKHCGYGIMIGAAPWYSGRATNGTVTGNRISNAKLALNIDGLTGPMTVTHNIATHSGGLAMSDCGPKIWPSVNIAPSSRPLVAGSGSFPNAGSIETSGCLLNRVDK